MTVAILVLLVRKLPDFFVRSLFWFKSLGKFQLKAVGMQHLPTEGPVILATNCKDMQSCLQLVSATDRTTKVVLVQDPAALGDGPVLRRLAMRQNLILVQPDQDVQLAWQEALATLKNGHLLALSLGNEQHATDLAALLHQLQDATKAPILPAYCGALDESKPPKVRVVFGEIMTQTSSLADCKKAIDELGAWIRANDDKAGSDQH